VAAAGFALGVRCTDGRVCCIEFLPPQKAVAPRTPVAADVVRQLRAYLGDPDSPFDLPLAPAGTPFQRRVWQAIAAIPRGEVRTYGELARSLRSAPRAVGQGCGANPYPIVVPCHRVVAAGALGGFAHSRGGWLAEVKRWLLAHEGRR
jgi:methylated-DNA-[protein]-cysteine S-methyltransferase